MFYYKFSINEWALHTAHLSPEEESVYFRLINHYYDTEQEIPLETDSVIRRLRLGLYSDTVDTILNEFFTKTEKGWFHKRCDEEISAYHSKAETNQRNGKRGGRPSKLEPVPAEKPKKTQSVISGIPTETQIINNKLEIKNNKLDKPDGVSVSVWEDYLKIRKSKKTPMTETALKGLIREATKAKKTLEEALIICCERSWIGFKADWIVESPTGGGGKKDDKSWMFSDAGIEKKAQELGITPYGHDTYQTLKQRCVQKMAERAIL